MTSIDKFTDQMADVIDLLKNDKIDVEQAKAIASLGKVAVDSYKVKVQVLGIMSKAENPNATKALIAETGIVSENKAIEK